MAITIVVKGDDESQTEIRVELEDDGNWEEKCYGVGCQGPSGKAPMSCYDTSGYYPINLRNFISQALRAKD